MDGYNGDEISDSEWAEADRRDMEEGPRRNKMKEYILDCREFDDEGKVEA